MRLKSAAFQPQNSVTKSVNIYTILVNLCYVIASYAAANSYDTQENAHKYYNVMEEETIIRVYIIIINICELGTKYLYDELQCIYYNGVYDWGGGEKRVVVRSTTTGVVHSKR